MSDLTIIAADVEYKAMVYAAKAHHSVGQLRKYSTDPYIVHPMEVAAIVRAAGGTPAMVAAAYMHDVLEDTTDDREATTAEMREIFGDEIANLVIDLSDVTTLKDGNRATRKAIERDRLAKVSAPAQTIKLADLISNARSIVVGNRAFAKVFIPEMKDLLEVLVKGDRALHAMASEIAETASAELGLRNRPTP